MSENNKVASKEFLAERDSRIFKMRQAGMSVAEIGRRFSVSSKVVSNAINRTLEKLNRETHMAYPEVLRMELERLDGLQAAIWPLTQHRKVTLDDGTEVQVEPDLKAIQQVLGIMDRRSKLLGMEQNNVNVQMEINAREVQPIRATLAGQDSMKTTVLSFDAESEARELLKIMAISGVLPIDTVAQMLGTSTILDADTSIQGDDDEQGQLESGDGQGS